jgi:nicotinate-nucleotide adenylyltransferase
MKKTVGLLGGSFDPVHFVHLNLAICLMESCSLDEVWFIPTSISPFKEDAPPGASSEHRLAMLRIALAPIKKFRILDWEIHETGVVYTIDTVRKIAQDHLLKLHLLLGEDHLASFHRWKEAEELIQLAPPLIGAREGVETLPSLSSDLREKLKSGRVKIPLLDISSTNIRQRLAQKRYCGHLVPAAALEYIQQNHLYT